MIDEGYIKFNIEHSIEPIKISEPVFSELSYWRTKLFDMNWIGETPEGIGFGNISILQGDKFYITGSATGAKRMLAMNGYAEVLEYNIDSNYVKSIGLSKASSETMSHAAIYECQPIVKAVVHIHDPKLWENYLELMPTTSKDVAFGTPQMAREIQSIINNPDNFHKGIIIMGGHQDGVISYGKSLKDAGEKLVLLK